MDFFLLDFCNCFDILTRTLKQISLILWNREFSQSPPLLLTIIKTALSGLKKKPHVGAVLRVLFFDVTSCFEAAAEPYGL